MGTLAAIAGASNFEDAVASAVASKENGPAGYKTTVHKAQVERQKVVRASSFVTRPETINMELLHSQLFSRVKELRGHLGKKIFKGYPTQGDSPGLLTLVKGGKDQEEIIAADLHQVLLANKLR